MKNLIKKYKSLNKPMIIIIVVGFVSMSKNSIELFEEVENDIALNNNNIILRVY